MADAKQAPVGTGLASIAKVDLQTRNAYMQHVVDANESGNDPLPFDQWMVQQKATTDSAKKDQSAGYDAAKK